MRKGDVWMRHISYKLDNQHIMSYNCLFEETDALNWNLQPPLAGYHPAIIEFSARVKNSIAVKREIEEQNQPVQTSNDIFADFYGSDEPKVEVAQKEKIEVVGNID
jgi:hypothetical protein